MCKQVEPRAVMSMLNDLYSRYDRMLDQYGVFKVETIGDCYFVAGGLMHEDEDGMVAAMLEAAKQVALPTNGEPVQIRIGIATGPVVSGVVGQRMPRFCLFGDTVNTASRMESTGVPGAIHVSQSTYELLKDEAWLPTGGIEVKGKGLMQVCTGMYGYVRQGKGRVPPVRRCW
ncbi:guanylyl and adenylyl cyclase family member [Volvox carteri f. nagariensis]|uniref:Guanylyl and adenylyl cyclase family member n=1 Tax=Volvox carteri f. nagariensis TaxID=3068 RepID=D8TWK7_VOLCA|nr:guanylyl and adenylyl cyclase family member [Volvox carteri f. nagariensis]EFJ48065.1 guanylyl and adenylyl cyclase family member [Volvox carteri f. nagariensis]|eukprot:XP_002950750.1 guanylyl and adenylyl cyclase family member [Volvox carteri f. nagariensis]